MQICNEFEEDKKEKKPTPFPKALYDQYKKGKGDLWDKRTEDWGEVCGAEENSHAIKNDGTYPNFSGVHKKAIANRKTIVEKDDLIAFPTYSDKQWPFYIARVKKIREHSLLIHYLGDKFGGPYLECNVFVGANDSKVEPRLESRFRKELKILHWGFKLNQNNKLSKVNQQIIELNNHYPTQVVRREELRTEAKQNYNNNNNSNNNNSNNNNNNNDNTGNDIDSSDSESDEKRNKTAIGKDRTTKTLDKRKRGRESGRGRGGRGKSRRRGSDDKASGTEKRKRRKAS